MITQNENEMIEGWKQKVKRLKKKYGMDFFQFQKQLGKKFNLSWEHEKDYMDWDWALTVMKTNKFVKHNLT